jgi:periplasmic divalent cation tolerance protein
VETNDSYVMYMIAAPVEAAEGLAQKLVEERAAACAQVTSPATSFFYWEGKLQRETEALIFVKTARDKRAAVQRVLFAHHPYQVPELIELPLTGGNEAYFRWMDRVLAGE